MQTQPVDPLITVLRRERRSRSLIQDDVAEMVGVDLGTLCAWERGRRTPPLAQLRLWVEGLGLDLACIPRGF